MEKKYLWASFLLSLLLLSCQPEQNKETDQPSDDASEGTLVGEENDLYKEVMAIHDEIMPIMSDIMALSKAIKQKAMDLDDPREKEEIQQMISDLEAANESMMNWMRKFNPNLENMTHEETMNYLKEEKVKIEEVRKGMELAQQRAEQYLQE